MLDSAPIDVKDPQLIDLVGEARFTSMTYRLFKLPGLLESLCEDYGQVAVYKGRSRATDTRINWTTTTASRQGGPCWCVGIARRWSATRWLGEAFCVTGDRSRHFGLFPCHFAVRRCADAGRLRSCC